MKTNLIGVREKNWEGKSRTGRVIEKQRKAKKTKVVNGAVPTQKITQIDAKVDVGWGNALFIRGKGAGLTWDKGMPLNCFNGSTWVWHSRAIDKVTFKLLINDVIWAQGEDQVVEAGSKVEVQPVFKAITR